MAPTRRPAVKKRKPLARSRPKLTVDAVRLALSAVERIRTVLARKGHANKLAPATTMKELAARASYLGVELPPSYSATMRAASQLGEPEVFLSAAEMKNAFDDHLGARMSRPDVERYAPFVRLGERRFLCFDREVHADHGELPVVEWYLGHATKRAQHFAEWLDELADTREEAVEEAADIPESLREVLLGLGFSFDDPIVGRLETGDTEAISELLGEERTREVMGAALRLFDSSGKTSLTLNLDEFTLAASLRTGIYVFEPEDVFRWLRFFRDENFFGEPRGFGPERGEPPAEPRRPHP